MAELAALRTAQRSALITQQVSTVVPNLTAPVLTGASSGLFTASAFGLWTTIVSSGTLTGHAITMVAATAAAGNTNYQIQIGTGAAGSEAVVADMAYAVGASIIPLYEAIIPAAVVPTNERVAIRFASPSTTNTLTTYIGAVPRPL